MIDVPSDKLSRAPPDTAATVWDYPTGNSIRSPSLADAYCTVSLPVRCRSVGWVVHEDERRIVVVPHLARDGDGDGEIAIPRDWLQRVVDLVEGKGRRRWR